MTAVKVLDRDMTFNDVPVIGTKRGFAIPRPAVLRADSIKGGPDAGDKEWDGRSASLGQLPKNYYLATMSYTQVGKAGFTKRVTAIRLVDQQEWVQARREWSQYLRDNAGDFTNTHQMVIANLGNAPIARSRTVTPVPSAPVVVPTVTALAVPQNLPVKSWDPNDPDIAYDLFEVPNDNPNFLPDQETFDILDAAWQQAMLYDEPRMILLYGDTSTGKTETPLIWAARRDQLHCRIDCGAFGEIYDVTGPIHAVEKNGISVTEWIHGKTIRAMADPRPAVIQLDEVNRISDVKAMNILFPFFDSARRSYFDDAKTWMKLNGIKLIVCTMNGDTRGDDIGEYVGTQPLDQAFISRFPIRRQLKYPNTAKLKLILEARNQGVLPAETIETVAQIATELVALNKFVPNLRELFACLDFLKTGTDLYHALKWTVGGIYKDDGTLGCDFTSFKAAIIGKGIQVPDDA